MSPPLELPDAELMTIVSERLTLLIARMVVSGQIPRNDWQDGAEAYRRVYMTLWLRLYYRAWFRHGTHDHAIMMASHLGALQELGAEAFRMVAKALRWDEWRQVG